MPDRSNLWSDEILVAVTNYEFNANAQRLKAFFAAHFPTFLIDSSSPTPPQDVDLIVENRGYRGLWNAAVELAYAGGYEWLFFIASDVQLVHHEWLIEIMIAISRDEAVALWTPSIASASRHAFKTCTHKPTAIVRHCGAAEGFCFLVRTAVLREQHPVAESNRFGYSIDMATAVRARGYGAVLVDDRVLIHHPPSRPEHRIDEALADALGKEYLQTSGLDPEILREIDLIEYHAKLGKPTVAYGRRRSLDLGCGGRIRDPFASGDAWGIDRVGAAAATRIARADLALEPIPFGDRSFDYVSAFHFLETLPRLLYTPQRRLPLVELMNEIHRVLRPGGLFLALSLALPGGDHGGDPGGESLLHGPLLTERTFPELFCQPGLAAASHGFRGCFRLEQQRFQPDGQLLTVLRASR